MATGYRATGVGYRDPIGYQGAAGPTDYAAAGVVAATTGASGNVTVNPGSPTPTPVLSAPYASSANVTTSGALSLSAGVGVDELLIVTAHGGGTSFTFSVSDSQSNSWNSATIQTCSTTPSSVQIWWTVVTNALTTSDTITVTRSTSGGLGVQAFSLPTGFSATSLDSDGAISNTSGTAVSVPTVTLANDTVAITAGTTQTARTATPTSPDALVDDLEMTGGGNPRYGWAQWSYDADGGTLTPAATLSAGNTWCATTVVFQPVGAPTDYAAAGTVPISSGVIGRTKPQYPADVHLATIGDSTTYRSGTTSSPPSRESVTRALMEAAGFATAKEYWYGVGGKTMLTADSSGNTTADNIVDAVAAVGTMDVWVIGLGTNDVGLGTTAFEAAVNDVLDSVAANGGGHVLWVNLAFYNVANTNATTYNPVLDAVAAARPSEMTVLDFNTYIHGAVYDAADWIYPTDSTHMTVQGWAKRDAYIRAAVLEWFDSYLVDSSAAATTTVTGNATITPAPVDYAAAGTVAATTAVSGNVTANLTASGTAAASTTASGAATANLAVSGTAAGTTAVSGDATITPAGPTDYSAAGTVAVTSGVTGNAVRVTPVSGTVAATTAQSGTVTATYGVSGAIPATSGASGTVAVRQAVSGQIAAVSDLVGQVTASYVVAAVVPIVTTISGSPTITPTITAYHVTGGAPVRPPTAGLAPTTTSTGDAPTHRRTGRAPTTSLTGGAPLGGTL